MAPNSNGASSILRFTPTTAMTINSKVLVIAKLTCVNNPSNGYTQVRVFDSTNARWLSLGEGANEGQLTWLDGSTEIGANTIDIGTTTTWVAMYFAGSGRLLSAELLEDTPGKASAVDYADLGTGAASRLDLCSFCLVADQGQWTTEELFAFVA